MEAVVRREVKRVWQSYLRDGASDAVVREATRVYACFYGADPLLTPDTATALNLLVDLITDTGVPIDENRIRCIVSTL